MFSNEDPTLLADGLELSDSDAENETPGTPTAYVEQKDPELAPGEQIQRIKKQSGHFKAADNIYRATRTVTKLPMEKIEIPEDTPLSRF